MSKTLSLLVTAFVLSVGVAAQEKKAVTTADFAGTWNIEVMSHQIALVIEPQEGNKVTATMMAMGRDTLLKGELVDRTLTLVGVKSETDAGSRTWPPRDARPRPSPAPATRRTRRPAPNPSPPPFRTMGRWRAR